MKTLIQKLILAIAEIAALMSCGCNMPSVTPQPVTPNQPTAHTITIKVEDGKIAIVGGADVTVKSAVAESVPVVNDPLPEVWAYSAPGCDHCKRAKSEFAAATDLPFRVIWKTDPPWWLESAAKPAFWFHVSRDQPSQDDVNNTRQTSGWPGLPEFRAKWTANRLSAAAASAPTPIQEVERVIGLLPKPEVGFVDYGSGDGRWCIAAAQQWGCRATGVEIDPARAAAARERVAAAGLSHLVTIITGDVLTTDVQADVGVAYLWSDALEQLRPRLEKLRAFASYQHQPPGLPVVQNGDSWLYFRPVVNQSRSAVWQGKVYSGPVCNSPGCAMCRSIRVQISGHASFR